MCHGPWQHRECKRHARGNSDEKAAPIIQNQVQSHKTVALCIKLLKPWHRLLTSLSSWGAEGLCCRQQVVRTVGCRYWVQTCLVPWHPRVPAAASQLIWAAHTHQQQQHLLQMLPLTFQQLHPGLLCLCLAWRCPQMLHACVALLLGGSLMARPPPEHPHPAPAAAVAVEPQTAGCVETVDPPVPVDPL
jgi:hypothetical protein